MYRTVGPTQRQVSSYLIIVVSTSLMGASSVSAEVIEDSLSVAPRHESVLFKNRDKFDLVALCDESSTSVRDSRALQSLFHAIYEVAFRSIHDHIDEEQRSNGVFHEQVLHTNAAAAYFV